MQNIQMVTNSNEVLPNFTNNISNFISLNWLILHANEWLRIILYSLWKICNEMEIHEEICELMHFRTDDLASKSKGPTYRIFKRFYDWLYFFKHLFSSIIRTSISHSNFRLYFHFYERWIEVILDAFLQCFIITAQ